MLRLFRGFNALIEAFVVDLLLGQGESLPDFKPLIEKALGRAVGPAEPKPFDLEALLLEQDERRRAILE